MLKNFKTTKSCFDGYLEMALQRTAPKKGDQDFDIAVWSRGASYNRIKRHNSFAQNSKRPCASIQLF